MILSLLLELAPVATLLFFWGVVTLICLFVSGMVYEGGSWSDSRLIAAFDYTLIFTIIFGAGMVVLGGCAWLMGGGLDLNGGNG